MSTLYESLIYLFYEAQLIMWYDHVLIHRHDKISFYIKGSRWSGACIWFIYIQYQMSLTTLTTMTTIIWICVLSRNRARVWEVWRRRCKWGKIWRTCAVAQSSLLLSLLSPPPLLPLCLTLRHKPYHGGWRNAACWIPAWYRPCRGLFRRWSIARQWQSRSAAVTHGWSPERLSLACGSGTKTRAWRCRKNGMSRRVLWLPVCQIRAQGISVCQRRAYGCCW